MGKKQNEIQKTGLGRALVKQHNQMIQQSKDKSRFYRKKFLESFTEVSDIDAVIEQSLEPTPNMSADELNDSETQAFLTWRHSLAR
ncbi:hypothetical protein glysoja_044720 [Glycine soja]|uniref:Uncharacterized protein n=1 Tax=Glycine soja TaxID=3848 RepID=A0A0B2P860_GLYSO|nr:hypothetical protein glysoja_044720 [Glycine soja]